MEIWDAYYPDGTLAGCNLVRGKPIPDGLYHLVSEILVRHADGDYLLMQRDPRKPNYGGFFEATAGGSALKGEDAYCCAIRELQEETGIYAGTLTNIGRFVSYNTIYETFLCIIDCEKDSVKLQEGETVSYKWVNEADFIAFVNSDSMIDVQFRRYEPLKTTYTNIKDLPLTLKAHEAAAVLRISKSKVYELAQSESFPAVRIGKRVVIPRDKLIQWMNDQAEVSG